MTDGPNNIARPPVTDRASWMAEVDAAIPVIGARGPVPLLDASAPASCPAGSPSCSPASPRTPAW
jgi:hypothetical protein